MAENERAPRNPDKKKDPTDKDIRDNIDSVKEVLNENMFSMELIRRNPELRELIKTLGRKLAKGKIDERSIYKEFKELLDETKFGKRPSSEIQADLQRYQENNANWKQRVGDLVDDIREISRVKMGKGIGSKETRDLAIQLIYSGKTDDQAISQALRQYVIVDEVEDDPATDEVESGQTQLGGALGNYQNDLLQWITANGVMITSNEMQRYIRKIDDGSMSLDLVKQDIRNHKFKPKYSAFTDRFDEGLDVTDIAAEYQQTVAKLLEKNQSDIGLEDRLVKKALQYIDPKTNQGRQLSGWEFEQMVREDPEWQQTDNAYAQYASVGRDLLKTFGFEV